MAAVPLPLSVKVTPEGRAPVSVSAGAGMPAAVTVTCAGDRMPMLAEAAPVMAGALPELITDTAPLALALVTWAVCVAGSTATPCAYLSGAMGTVCHGVGSRVDHH